MPPTTDVAKLTPIQQLNFYNKELENSLFAWRGALTDNAKVQDVLSDASVAMGLASQILNEQKNNPNSPQAQLALRALRLAKTALEELKKRGFGSSQKVQVGSEALGATDFLDYFEPGGGLHYTNTFVNAPYQDTYFKHYFALLFSPAFKNYSQLDIIRLANTLTDAAEQGSVSIKMPFKNKAEADEFIAFAKGGGIPFCRVSGSSQEAGFVEGGRQIALLSLVYDARHATPTTEEKTAPAAPSTIREYTFARKATSEFMPLTDGVYGNSPTLQQMQREHSSSEQAKKTAYTYFNEMHYAEKFNEANTESKASAMNVFIDLINNYMQYMGHSIDAYDPPRLQTFFASDAGKEFLAEFKKFYEAGSLVGTASVEKQSQLVQNQELGMKRAKLFQTVANEMLHQYQVDKQYWLSEPARINGKAVSVWGNADAVIKSWAGRLDRLENSNMTDYPEYSQLARALLFGDYTKANELNSSLKAVNKAFLEAISGQKAALVKNADGTYSINNPALLEKLLARNDTTLGLRFEGTLIGASKPRDRFGAFFVDALLEPDRGIEVTTKGLDTKLKVEVSETARTGSKVTAKVTVFVDIEGKDRQFLLNSAHTLNVLGKTADGIELPLVFAKDDGEQKLVNGKKATVFEVTFNTDKELYIMANAHKAGLESGWAWQKSAAEEIEPAYRAPFVYGETLKNVDYGKVNPLGFTAYHDESRGKGQYERKKIGTIHAFGIHFDKTGLNYAPDYFIYPGKRDEMKIRKEVPTYKLGEDFVVVDRNLNLKNELHLGKNRLQELAQKGVVGLRVAKPGGKEIWVKLDGSLIDAKTVSNAENSRQGFRIDEDYMYLKQDPATPSYALRSAVSFNDKPNEINFKRHTMATAFVPNALVLASSADVRLARLNVIAQVKRVKSDRGKAVVTRIDGKPLGTMDISVLRDPTKSPADNRLLNEEKIRKEIAKLGGGLFLYRAVPENQTGFYFNYDVFCPNFQRQYTVIGYASDIPAFARDFTRVFDVEAASDASQSLTNINNALASEGIVLTAEAKDKLARFVSSRKASEHLAATDASEYVIEKSRDGQSISLYARN